MRLLPNKKNCNNKEKANKTTWVEDIRVIFFVAFVDTLICVLINNLNYPLLERFIRKSVDISYMRFDVQMKFVTLKVIRTNKMSYHYQENSRGLQYDTFTSTFFQYSFSNFTIMFQKNSIGKFIFKNFLSFVECDFFL